MRDDIIETVEKGDFIGKIYPFTDGESPRSWSNMGVMFCSHRRYNLGDEQIPKGDFESWGEITRYLVKKRHAVIVLPLYLYDHSGLRMKVGSFQGLLPQGHAEFDSGQVGYIYVTRETVLKEYGHPAHKTKPTAEERVLDSNPWIPAKRLTKKMLEKAEKYLRGEVETYDQYLSGDVYGYIIVRKNKCDECGNEEEEILDSVCDFYGMETVRQELNNALDRLQDESVIQEAVVTTG